MFYCDSCAEQKGYPESIGKSRGTCEICGKVKICNDVSCSKLPKPKNKEKIKGYIDLPEDTFSGTFDDVVRNIRTEVTKLEEKNYFAFTFNYHNDFDYQAVRLNYHRFETDTEYNKRIKQAKVKRKKLYEKLKNEFTDEDKLDLYNTLKEEFENDESEKN